MDGKNRELYEKMGRLQWLMQRWQTRSHAKHGPFADPSRGQGRVLALLKLQPEITTKDLAYLLGIRQQSLNELLNKLEKAELVTREPLEEDRRVMVVRLTEKGKQAQQSEEGEQNGIFDGLSEEEQAAFSGYLDRVIAALEEKVGDEQDIDWGSWMEAARSRMGEEKFDYLMGMWGGKQRPGFGGPHKGPGRPPRPPRGPRRGHGPQGDWGDGSGEGCGPPQPPTAPAFDEEE
ncbi:MarR family transcriptional regulator [Ruminococcaceae bacterium OttesenSCG-928-I18]|nr:MarR family transcriptional regulator [Ruminococcaceae bacterium OttesenSCG-928-I18]